MEPGSRRPRHRADSFAYRPMRRGAELARSASTSGAVQRGGACRLRLRLVVREPWPSKLPSARAVRVARDRNGSERLPCDGRLRRRSGPSRPGSDRDRERSRRRCTSASPVWAPCASSDKLRGGIQGATQDTHPADGLRAASEMERPFVVLGVCSAHVHHRLLDRSQHHRRPVVCGGARLCGLYRRESRAQPRLEAGRDG